MRVQWKSRFFCFILGLHLLYPQGNSSVSINLFGIFQFILVNNYGIQWNGVNMV